ncbi:MAG: type II toxin-antitoxin system RatA family toxin [Oxalobacter sp.]|nr:MAG: type II toxin-antitoxin system RatA family toxin [Oxalobacter sp.]
MAFVNKSVLLEYSAEQMFALVDNIEAYPTFLPWCGDVEVKRSDDNGEVLARITIDFNGFRKSFTTKNANRYPEAISMSLVEGPFNKLQGGWTFKPLRDNACKVELNLEYDMQGHVLAALIEQVFGAIAVSMIDAFCRRAKEIYG